MDNNCYTFDASTGNISDGAQLDMGAHPKILLLGRGNEKEHVKTCVSKPPEISGNKIFRADIDRNRLTEATQPQFVLIHASNCHKIKTLAGQVEVLGHNRALIKLPLGSEVKIHNGNKKWKVRVPSDNLELQVVAA